MQRISFLLIFASIFSIISCEVESTGTGKHLVVLIYTDAILKQLVLTLDRFTKALPSTHWSFLVFAHRISEIDINDALTNHEILERLTVSDFGFHGRGVREMGNNLLNNISFWNSLNSDKILFIQTDSAICTRSPYKLEQFMQYDFIGAPHEDYAYFPNGGFSLRSKAAMLYCVETLNANEKHNEMHEDFVFARCLANSQTQMHWKLPDNNTMSQFSAESTLYEPQPLGMHKLWRLLTDKEDWKRFRKYCPEAEDARRVYLVQMNVRYIENSFKTLIYRLRGSDFNMTTFGSLRGGRG